MITLQAKDSFDEIFTKAIRDNISASSDDVITIESINNTKEIVETEFVFMTIFSPFFSLISLFHINVDQQVKDYFEKREHKVNEEIGDSCFVDRFQEFCNICCGSMNRELHKNYTYLGMSTPYVLSNHCFEFIETLTPGYIKHFSITINHVLQLHATLCVCDYGTVDFKTIPSVDEDDTTGELELF